MRLRTRAVVAVLVMAAASACADFFGPYPYASPPEALEFHEGGYGGNWTYIRVSGDSVHVFRGEFFGTEYDSLGVRPTREQWRRFWIGVDEAGVRRWRAQYFAEGIVDGHGWGITFEQVGVRYESSGSNRYPRYNGAGSRYPTAEYHRVLAAFEDLIGTSLF